ncbi:transposase [Photobacterium iliopiscarium]|uniref:transposase n=1 Tax=Photobacterium iliopiscarium TaxID=56192 RepID=UPI001E5FB7A7|nr:transposase [Photobacterium iliopiscarium]MCD9486630.1 transposase [Photobacterium iliopiscarium]MCF2243207.1 transposase [Photobacterium iliopiscarium]
MFESFSLYKSKRKLKAVFKVNAAYTSLECANCGHIHKDNRKSQADFICVACGHTDNEDKNASKVIKKRAINLIKDSGTELSKRNVLQDIGRGDKNKTVNRKTNRTVNEASKKIKVERSLEAVSFYGTVVHVEYECL